MVRPVPRRSAALPRWPLAVCERESGLSLLPDARPFRARRMDTLDDVKKGEGKIVRLHGRKFAAYRDDEGHVTVCSPVCTHLKCIVRWNEADRTWDCPATARASTRPEQCWAGHEEPLAQVDIAELQE